MNEAVEVAADGGVAGGVGPDGYALAMDFAAKIKPGTPSRISVGELDIAVESIEVDESGVDSSIKVPGRYIAFHFADYTTMTLAIKSGSLDEGPALLEPITAIEYQGLEASLHVLWQAVESGELQEHHRLQLRCLVDLLADDHRSADVGETRRHTVVGSMRSIVLFANHEGVRAGLAWWKLAEILTGMNWVNLAHLLAQGPR